ncbi:MAG: hypothetical protein ACFCAD_00610 [Pleurocapsa sp.]
MNSFLQKIVNINFKKILTTFLVGSLLIVSTACSQGDIAQVKNEVAKDVAQKAMSDDYDQYDAKQTYKGGMNGYNDDRRYDAETAAKTKTLVDTAERREADSLGEFVDNVGERSVLNEDVNEKATKAFSRKLERNKDKALEYVDDKSDKLERNLEKVPGEAKDVFDGAVDTAQDAIEDARKATKSAAKEVKGNFEDLS